jgi:uncharacterized membrane protein YidH (DUF202 family)
MPSHRTASHAASPRWLPLILAGFLGLVGYLGPWTPHRAAGLVVTGLDLGEYVKFIPQVMSEQVSLHREIFYLPLLAGSLTASLVASRRALPWWGRFGLGLSAIPLALAMLPPAWTPGTLLQPEFRLQTIAILLCLVMVPGILITRYLPDRLILAVIGLLAVAAAVAPAWGYWRVRGAMEELYRHPLAPSWGFWLEIGGFLLLAFLAVAGIFAQRKR